MRTAEWRWLDGLQLWNTVFLSTFEVKRMVPWAWKTNWSQMHQVASSTALLTGKRYEFYPWASWTGVMDEEWLTGLSRELEQLHIQQNINCQRKSILIVYSSLRAWAKLSICWKRSKTDVAMQFDERLLFCPFDNIIREGISSLFSGLEKYQNLVEYQAGALWTS